MLPWCSSIWNISPHQIAPQTKQNKTSPFGSVKRDWETTGKRPVQTVSTHENLQHQTVTIQAAKVGLDKDREHRSPQRLIGQETISPGNIIPSK